MNDTTAWNPLTLRAHRDGYKVGTVVHGGKAYPVRVTTTDKVHYNVFVDLDGSLKKAGVVRRAGTGWDLHSFDANSKSRGPGYREMGTLAANAERIVHDFLHNVEYAAAEAAKTPEQRQAEAEAREASDNLYRNRMIARQAQEMLATMERLVPDSTIHYAVEGARAALATLIREADKGSIKTAVTPAKKD